VPVSNAAFTIKVTDASNFSATKAFTLTVTATYLKPVLTQPVLGTTTVGVPFSFTPVATNYPSSFTVSGLPAGIKYVAATKTITGRATVSGVFNVRIAAVNAAGARTALGSQLTVRALPNTLMGSFSGLVARDATANAKLGSTLSLTTTSTGAYTAKVTTGATLKSYIGGFLIPTAPQINSTATAALPALVLTLDTSTNLISGTYNGAPISGWKQTWNATTNPPVNLQGYYSVGIDLKDAGDDGISEIPQGSGYATFTVAAAGTLTVSGKTADGQVITTSGFVGPNGQILVHTSLYANKGSISGTLTLSEDAEGAFANNVASGDLTWVKPVTTGHTYETGFGLTALLNLKAYGKYLASAPTGQEVLGLPGTGLASLTFEDGGLGPAQSVIDPDVTGFTYTDANKILMPAVNTGKVALTIAPTSGLVGGSFTLVDSAPALTRKVIIQGQIVRTASGATKATGYFLLPQKPAPGKTLATSSILSGKLSITQQQ
ncbi:MAG: putative Ig protein, partial [Verrucomicrobiaceae bacterium]|nr:putative Ig protein [Verrucomicrobiaceae bacterium]